MRDATKLAATGGVGPRGLGGGAGVGGAASRWFTWYATVTAALNPGPRDGGVMMNCQY